MTATAAAENLARLRDAFARVLLLLSFFLSLSLSLFSFSFPCAVAAILPQGVCVITSQI